MVKRHFLSPLSQHCHGCGKPASEIADTNTTECPRPIIPVIRHRIIVTGTHVLDIEEPRHQ